MGHKLHLILMFLIFCASYILVLAVTEYVLVDEDLFYNSYSHILNDNEISSLIGVENDRRWIYYLTAVMFFFIKFLILTFFILSVAFFYDRDFKFRSVYLSFIESEFLFIIPLLIKMLWFLFIDTSFTIQDISLFYPFSLHNLFSFEHHPQFTYVLQTLNLFELAYLFILAERFTSHLEISYSTAIKHVFAGYVPVLFLWFIIYTFVLSLAI